MDHILRRQLDKISRDDESGASELTIEAAAAVTRWLRRHSHPNEQEVLQVARALLFAQPCMAPLLRLANEAALAVDAPNLARSLAIRVGRFGRLVREGPERIARHFRKALGPEQHTFATYSYSSTVTRALIGAKKYLSKVACSESRPGNEGRHTARELAQAGISILFTTDAGLMSIVHQFGAFVTGADALERAGFINKAGTEALALCARESHVPVWVLADTSKLLPAALASKHWRSRPGPRVKAWPHPPAGITNVNPYFAPAEFGPHVRVVTEIGWLTPEAVRKEVRKIQVSPRIWALTH